MPIYRPPSGTPTYPIGDDGSCISRRTHMRGRRREMTIHMNIAMVLMITLLAGWLMAIAGVQKSALEWRRRRRICPSCGREIRARICTTCTTA